MIKFEKKPSFLREKSWKSLRNVFENSTWCQIKLFVNLDIHFSIFKNDLYGDKNVCVDFDQSYTEFSDCTVCIYADSKFWIRLWNCCSPNLTMSQVKLGISQIGIPISDFPNWNFDFDDHVPNLTWDIPS